MSTPTTEQPMSRRDVWLTIALAVARDGLPVPDEFDLRPAIAAHDLPPHATLSYNAGENAYARPVDVVLHEAAEAARILRLTETYMHPEGIVWEWRVSRRHGWVWSVQANTPRGTLVMPPKPEAVPDSLSEQVVAAIGGAS